MRTDHGPPGGVVIGAPVAQEHHVGGQERDHGVDIAHGGGGQERLGHPELVGIADRAGRRCGVAQLAPGAHGLLTHGGLALAQHGATDEKGSSNTSANKMVSRSVGESSSSSSRNAVVSESSQLGVAGRVSARLRQRRARGGRRARPRRPPPARRGAPGARAATARRSGRCSRWRARSRSRPSRETTVVSQASGLSTSARSQRCQRNHASCTTSSASLIEPNRR